MASSIGVVGAGGTDSVGSSSYCACSACGGTGGAGLGGAPKGVQNGCEIILQQKGDFAAVQNSSFSLE